MRHITLWKTVSFACILTFACPLYGRTWRITDFDDSITIQSDGSATVHERISLAFRGQFQGIHRTIPIEYPGPRGTNYTLFIEINGVTDEAGHRLKFESK